MSKTYRENVSITDSRDFGEELLESIISWVERRLEPTQVFPEDYIIRWISNNYSPEDVFTYDQLVEWAADNLDTK